VREVLSASRRQKRRVSSRLQKTPKHSRFCQKQNRDPTYRLLRYPAPITTRDWEAAIVGRDASGFVSSPRGFASRTPWERWRVVPGRTDMPWVRRPVTAEPRSAAGATTRALMRPARDLRVAGAEARRQTGATADMAAMAYA
jgi:hypothetical protein